MRDASVILYHSVTEAEYLKINGKKRFAESQPELKDYDVYDRSVKVLEQGITAVKYNYCNDGVQNIQLRLSSDHKKIQYKPSDGLLSSLKPWKSVPLTDLQGIVYGGSTTAFKNRRKPVIE